MNNVIVGLDIGTAWVRVVLAEKLETGEMQILGVGTAESTGVRRGAIVNLSETVRAIQKAVDSAEMMSGVEITHCAVAIGGVHIESINSKGVGAVSGKVRGGKKMDQNEIDQTDVDRVIMTATALDMPLDRKIIHVIPQSYTVDGLSAIKDPRDMFGVRLEVIVHIITGSITCIQNIINSVKRTNLSVDTYMYHGLAAVKAVMTEEEQELGSILVDIGAGTTDVLVVKNGAPILTFVLPVGGNQLTGDLAAVKNISFEAAEKIKKKDGICWMPLVEEDSEILLPAPGGRPPIQIAKYEICEIFQMRMNEIFLMVKEKTSAVISERNFAGSIILCGGSSLLTGCVELANYVFDTSAVRVGIPQQPGGMGGDYQTAEFAAVIGLVLNQGLGGKNREMETRKKSSQKGNIIQRGLNVIKDIF